MTRALVIGAGGLGTPALLALAEAGVRQLGIIDSDRVELSNLHRQILYGEADVGAPKADVAGAALTARFEGLEVQRWCAPFAAPLHDLVRDFEVVLDGTDRFETKLAISDVCVDRGVPYVFAAVTAYEGQVMAVRPGHSACLRCLFDEAPPPGAAPTCEALGILGPVAGLVAAEQVRSALGLLAGDASVVDRIWLYDGAKDAAREVRLRQAADCRGCGGRIDQRGVLAADRGGRVPSDAPVLDLSGQVCPATYVQTNRALSRLPAGGLLWVHLTSDESARNVPASAESAGYRVLARTCDGHEHRVLFERPCPATTQTPRSSDRASSGDRRTVKGN